MMGIKSKTMKTKTGVEFIIDDDDLEKFSGYGFIATTHKGRYKIEIRKLKSKDSDKKYLLHRAIMNCPKNMVVDHIDGNWLNNSKKNLRICTVGQNNMNKKISVKNTTGYKGVVWYKGCKKYGASLTYKNKRIWLGYFEKKEDAANAYDKAAIKYFGKYAKLNRDLVRN